MNKLLDLVKEGYYAVTVNPVDGNGPLALVAEDVIDLFLDGDGMYSRMPVLMYNKLVHQLRCTEYKVLMERVNEVLCYRLRFTLTDAFDYEVDVPVREFCEYKERRHSNEP